MKRKTEVLQHNVFEKWPLPNRSVQAIITSPPYWCKEDYDIPDVKIGDWTGQYGWEEKCCDYIFHTMLWIEEAERVLKDNGILFLNLADSTNGSKQGITDKKVNKNRQHQRKKYKQKYIKTRNLLQIPSSVASLMIDNGWILLRKIIWYKPNGKPMPFKDNFYTKYEEIFMFSKNQGHYFDLDSVRVSHKKESLEREERGNKLEVRTGRREGQGNKYYDRRGFSQKNHPLGKNPADVWFINTKGSNFKHYCMWPEKLVKRMVLCSTKPGDIILDPFCGSGSTLKVAEANHRIGIGFDLGYQKIQEENLGCIQKELIL